MEIDLSTISDDRLEVIGRYIDKIKSNLEESKIQYIGAVDTNNYRFLFEILKDISTVSTNIDFLIDKISAEEEMLLKPLMATYKLITDHIKSIRYLIFERKLDTQFNQDLIVVLGLFLLKSNGYQDTINLSWDVSGKIHSELKKRKDTITIDLRSKRA